MLKIVGAFFVCLWCADFLTGFFHWMEDTYCLEHYPLIGQFICEPNIEHHVNPQLMVRTGTFISRNLLKDLGLIQAHRQHSMHHKPPHMGYYCVLTSQVNAVLERVSFWRGLEKVIAFTTGIAPKRENRRDAVTVKAKV